MSDAVRFPGSREAARFHVVTCHEPDRTAVYLRGELDANTAPQSELHLDQLHRNGHHGITLDLSQVAFLGAAALGVFVRTDYALRTTGGTLVLSRPYPNDPAHSHAH
jgi:anti-sigma B factor antagonist